MLKTVSSITNAIGALNYKGTWNASTNTPALASGVGTKGDYYVVSVAGSTTLDGISNWGVGDWAVYNGAVWQRVEGGADLNGVNLTFTGTASGPTYETSNLTTGVTLTNNSLSADGTDTNIDLLANPKGTGGFGINGAPAGVVAGAAFTSKFCVKNENSSAIGGFVQANNTTASAGSGIFACRSRGTLAAPTVVQSGDNLASLFFLGNDGTDLAIAAEIKIDVDGTPGNNDMPGRIVFKTTPDGSEIPAEAMRIHSSSGVSIGNTTDPGATNLSVTGTITAASLTTTSNIMAGSPAITPPLSGISIGAQTTSGSELVLKNSSGIVNGELIGGVAFGHDDPTGGTGPHYSGIQARSTDSSGTMVLKFFTGLTTYETGTGEILQLSNTGATVTGDLTTTGSTILGDATTDTTTVAGTLTVNGLIKPQQATTAGAPAYVKGGIYFDTTLNKLRVGGATAWETITSV